MPALNLIATMATVIVSLVSVAVIMSVVNMVLDHLFNGHLMSKTSLHPRRRRH